MKRRKILTIGWREWVSLPDLGVPRIKAKIDTGAATSALHAYRIRVEDGPDGPWVSFIVHPMQRDSKTSIPVRVPLLEMRHVRSSSGHRVLRPVIKTAINIGAAVIQAELTLADRDEMGFRMLLGRRILRRRFLVDVSHSYLTEPLPPGSHL